MTVHDTPFSFKNGVWRIKKREQFWKDLGEQLFDEHLEIVKQVALEVLTLDDPAFELPAENRLAANIYGKVLPHSDHLRKGLAETLALLGNQANVLSNCSENKAENITITTIRELFHQGNWLRWGSLNSLLPTLSEASPRFFLEAVEQAMTVNDCPFDELFAQENSGVFGQNYLAGLLWALENIAWEEQYLTRVSVVLAEIASHDFGGNWANRPINSLCDIFLPWYPQTLSSVEKRQVAIKTICKEQPEIGWDLLKSLLPNLHSYTTGTYKPKWRNIVSEGWKPEISEGEYRKQNRFHSELLVKLAEFNVEKLAILIGKLHLLSQSALDKLKEKLSSKQCLSMPEESKAVLWNELIKFIKTHREYTDTDWALGERYLTSLDVIAEKLAPQNYKLLYQRLFNEDDFELYEKHNHDWETEHNKLFDKRKQAVSAILETDGLQGVLDFAWGVKKTSVVGSVLVSFDNQDFDSDLLPNFLDKTDEKKWSLIVEYVYEKRKLQGWSWFDDLDKTNWTKEEIALLLTIMPFEKTAWDRASQLLSKDENLYWQNTNAFSIDTKDGIDWAISKLLEVERPHIALACAHHSKYKINIDLVSDVLLALVKSDNLQNNMIQHYVREAIKKIQNTSVADKTKLFHVEWAYLSMLQYSGVSSVTLEKEIATDPNFFCQLIRMAYKSDIDSRQEKINPAMARNAHLLLLNWKTVPGTSDEGFDDTAFNQWLNEVEKMTHDSGHYDVAMTHVGQMLIHAPCSDKLWIHPEIAEAMNAKERQKIRDGYDIAIHNSRGVYTVDPEAKTETKLADKYRQQAEEIENAGYYRLAMTLRNISDSYQKEAERILNDRTLPMLR